MKKQDKAQDVKKHKVRNTNEYNTQYINEDKAQDVKKPDIETGKEAKLNKKNIVITIIGICVLIYLVYTIYLLIKQPTNVFTIEEGKLYQEETAIGYVIRNEKVVKGENYKNGMEQIIAEGEKAGVEENIFRYYSANEENLKQKIAELDVKVQEAMESEINSVYTSDMKLLEDQIDEKIENISKITDVSKLVEYKKEIDNLVTKKAKTVGESSPRGSYLNELIETRKNYENELNSGAEYVKAPMSGVVSYRVDGLEEVLTPESFDSLTKEYLESLDLKTGKMVATSEECGKVIDNFGCYIAVNSESPEAMKAEIGDKIKVRLSNNSEVSVEIVNIKDEENGNRVLVLKLSEQIPELINYRKTTLDLIWWSSSGLKVPNKAIVEKDGLSYVVRNRAGYLNELLVKVTAKGDKYSIVEPYSNEELKELGYTTENIAAYKKISLYDEILINPIMNE